MAPATYEGETLPIPIGQAGLYGLRRVPVAGLIQARHLTYEGKHLEKEGGAAKQNTTALPDNVKALLDWWPDAATQRTLAVCDDGKVYRDDGTAWTFNGNTAILTGLTVPFDQPPMLVPCGAEAPGNNKKCALFTGKDPVKVGSGDFVTMATIATPSVDWAGVRQPAGGIVHDSRLFVWVGHTLYWSTTTNHEDFTGAGSGSRPIFPGVGHNLVAAMVSRKMLILCKYPVGVFVLDTSDPSPANWSTLPLTLAIGAAGPLAVCAVPNDVLVVDASYNLHLLSATGLDRDAQSSDISTPKLGDWETRMLNAARAPWTTAVYDGHRQRVQIGLPGIGQSQNTLRLVVDLTEVPSVGPRFSESDRDTPESLMVKLVAGVERVFVGQADGFIYRLDETARSKDGAGFQGLWRTDDLNVQTLVAGWNKAMFDFLELELEGVGAYDLSVNIYINGVKKTATPLLFGLTGGAGVLPQVLPFVLGEARRQNRRRALEWDGPRIAIEGFNSGPDQTFKILNVYLGMRRSA